VLAYHTTMLVSECSHSKYEKKIKMHICIFGIPIQQRHFKTSVGERSC
jgi:hypothetical protein